MKIMMSECCGKTCEDKSKNGENRTQGITMDVRSSCIVVLQNNIKNTIS